MLCALFLAVTTTVAPTDSSDDWSRFRGPGGAGLAPELKLPAALSESNVRWKVALGVEGHSTPVASQGRLYLTGVHSDGHRELQCRDAEDGELQWTRELPFVPEKQHQLNSPAASTPAVDEDRVYVAWTDDGRLILQAFSLEGADGWQCDLGPYSAQHGSGVSPIVVGGMVVMGKDHEGEQSFLCGVDAATGEIRWKRPRETTRASYMTPVLYRNPEGQTEVVFASTSHGLTALDPQSGELRWETDPGFQQRCVAGPGFADGVFFQTAGSGGGGKESVAVRPYGADGEPEVLYDMRRGLPYVPAPLGVRDRLILVSDSGIASAIRAADGELLWQERLAEASFFGSPILVGEHALIMSKEGELFVLGTGDAFELHSRFDLGEPSFATPTVAGGLVVLRTLSHLVAIGGPVAQDG